MFAAVGLSVDEEAVYLAVVDRPGAGIDALEPLGLGPVRTRSVLTALAARGLVAQLPGRSRRYTATSPDVALEALVRSREDELQQIRLTAAGLAERYREARSRLMQPGEVVEVVTTAEATIQRWHEVQRRATREIVTFDRPPYLTSSLNKTEIELLGRGIGYRSVYDTTALDTPQRVDEVLAMGRLGERSRVVDGVPVKMFIADASIGLLSLQGTSSADSALVVHASSLLDSLVALFEEVWRRAVPVTLDPLVGEGVLPVDAELLSLLAAGLTDDAIARQRGVHERTVRRHVRRLLDDLGVATRFQAGVQAGRRGWL
jgi:sugar-specific transcriptional regulator TrmB/DNA-binding CsgD family transcriptional regulator